jgi:hypothetical protein
MSVDYYLACEKCMKCYHVAQDGFSGFGFYSKEPRCMKGIGPFLAEHVLHGIVRLLPEYDTYSHEVVEWPREDQPPPQNGEPSK